MSDPDKKKTTETDIIQTLNDEISEMRKKTDLFQDENPFAGLDSDLVDMTERIHSGVLPRYKKPTLH